MGQIFSPVAFAFTAMFGSDWDNGELVADLASTYTSTDHVMPTPSDPKPGADKHSKSDDSLDAGSEDADTTLVRAAEEHGSGNAVQDSTAEQA